MISPSDQRERAQTRVFRDTRGASDLRRGTLIDHPVSRSIRTGMKHRAYVEEDVICFFVSVNNKVENLLALKDDIYSGTYRIAESLRPGDPVQYSTSMTINGWGVVNVLEKFEQPAVGRA